MADKVYATINRQALPDVYRSAFSLKRDAIAAFHRGYVNVGELTKPFVQRQLPTVRNALLFSYLKGYERVKITVPLGLDLSTQIAALKKSLSLDTKKLEDVFGIIGFRALKTATDEIDLAVRTAIIELIGRNVHVDEAVDFLGGLFKTLGITTTNGYRVETLFRTISAIGMGAGMWAAFQDPAVDEILWGYFYTAVKDNRTRLNHQAANGTTLPKDHPFWQTMWVPNGYNCRCNIIGLYTEMPLVFPKEGAHADPGWGYNPGIVVASGPKLTQGIGFSFSLSYSETLHPRDEHGRWAKDATVTIKKENIGGSTGAKLVEMNGELYVMKDYGGRLDQLKTEYITNRLYHEFGQNAGAPVSQVRMVNGKTVLLNPFIKSLKFNGLMKDADKNFVMDSWLANWDVVGLTNDNIALDPLGKVHRIDNGGALQYRAQGGLKGNLFGHKVNELMTLRDSKMNPTAAKVFKNLTQADINKQIEHLQNVYSVSKMTEIVKSGHLSANMEHDLLVTLDARVKDLARTRNMSLSLSSSSSFTETLHPRDTKGQFTDKGLPTTGHDPVYKVGTHTTEGTKAFTQPASAQEIYDYLTPWVSANDKARRNLSEELYALNSNYKFEDGMIRVPIKYDATLVPNILRHAYKDSLVVLVAPTVDAPKPQLQKSKYKKPGLQPSTWTPQTAEAFGKTPEEASPGIALLIHDFVPLAKKEQIVSDLAQLNHGSKYHKGTLFVPAYYSKSTTGWLKEAMPGVQIKYKTTLGKLNPNNPKGKGYKGTSITPAEPGQKPLPVYKQPSKKYKTEKLKASDTYGPHHTVISTEQEAKVEAWYKDTSSEFKKYLQHWLGSSYNMHTHEDLIFDTPQTANALSVKKVAEWNAGLDKGPIVEGVDLYRGFHGIKPEKTELWDLWTTVGSNITLKRTQSASRKSTTGAGFSGGNLMVKFINSNNGVDIGPVSHIGGEKEVLIRSNTHWRVVKVEKNIQHSGKPIKAYVTVEQIHDKQ